MPLNVSLTLQTAVLEGTLEWEDWELVDIYADEGITGLEARKRDDFNRMMEDCRKRKIDQILVKSLSRFARNTVDTLACTRRLKEVGVGVVFLSDGITAAFGSSADIADFLQTLSPPSNPNAACPPSNKYFYPTKPSPTPPKNVGTSTLRRNRRFAKKTHKKRQRISRPLR